jgi:hypothetical protein
MKSGHVEASQAFGAEDVLDGRLGVAAEVSLGNGARHAMPVLPPGPGVTRTTGNGQANHHCPNGSQSHEFPQK